MKQLTDKQIEYISERVLTELVYEYLTETLPLPDFEKRRREKYREKQKQDRERDNERHLDRVKQYQQKELERELTEEDCEDDEEQEYPLLAIPEFNKLHGTDGKFVGDKRKATCYSSQWTDGSISRMPGRKAVSRKGGVGRKTKYGGKGKNKCKEKSKKIPKKS